MGNYNEIDALVTLHDLAQPNKAFPEGHLWYYISWYLTSRVMGAIVNVSGYILDPYNLYFLHSWNVIFKLNNFEMGELVQEGNAKYKAMSLMTYLKIFCLSKLFNLSVYLLFLCWDITDKTLYANKILTKKC